MEGATICGSRTALDRVSDRMVIIDTDVLIDFLEGDNSVREAVYKRMQYGKVATTIINQYELFKGVESREQEDAIDALLSKLEVYVMDHASMKNAALAFQALKKSGYLIPEADILVAGIAQSHGETILTRDHHFKKLQMIKTEII